jgi:hypothetical protein
MRGLGLIVYGSSGVGKTSFASRFPGPVKFISLKETGFEDLADSELMPANCTNVNPQDWEDLEDATLSTLKGTLVIDSCSGLQEMLFNEVCRTVYNSDWDKFTEYWKGQRVDSPVFLAKYQTKLDTVRNRGVHVIVIGHMATEETPNTLGANYLTHTLDMDKAVKASMIKWAGNILFLNIDINIVTVTEVAKDKTVLTGKAKDSDKRVIWTETSPGHIAKNRMNLPPVIKMGSSPDEAFKNFWKVLPDPYKRTWPVPGCEVK